MSRRLTAWAFLTRAGSEGDLIEELGEVHVAAKLADGVVTAVARPARPDGGFADQIFARQAMRVDGEPVEVDPEPLAGRLARAIQGRLPKSGEAWRWTLQIVAPDSHDPKDPRRRVAEELARVLPELLRAKLGDELAAKEAADAKDAERLVQVWCFEPRRALVGVTMTEHAITRVAGGRMKMKRPAGAASRAGLKLEEAIEWIGVGPDKGEICADLGAAPGGWSQVAVRRGANVIAVDPANVKADLPRAHFTHVKQNAFDFAPAETLDWLLCDMAWRPLEVAQLVAKWGRRVWARQFFANVKLPMKKKVEILRRVFATLEAAGWRGLRARQLYFDRDEVTLFGWLDPNIARKGAQAPFEMGSRRRREEKGPRRAEGEGPTRRAAPAGKGPRGKGGAKKLPAKVGSKPAKRVARKKPPRKRSDKLR